MPTFDQVTFAARIVESELPPVPDPYSRRTSNEIPDEDMEGLKTFFETLSFPMPSSLGRYAFNTRLTGFVDRALQDANLPYEAEANPSRQVENYWVLPDGNRVYMHAIAGDEFVFSRTPTGTFRRLDVKVKRG